MNIFSTLGSSVTSTLLIYGLMGLAVAWTLIVKGLCRWSWSGGVSLVAGMIFWPLFIPALLGAAQTGSRPTLHLEHQAAQDPRLLAVQGQLTAALNALDGVFAATLAPEVSNLEQLTQVLARQRARVAEMDRMIEATQTTRTTSHARARLLATRQETAERYEQALDQLEEISVTMMLLRLADQPEGEVLERLRELTGRIELITEGMQKLE